MSIYSYMRNTLKSLRESIIVKNPKFLDFKEEIAEIFDLYEQEKRSQNVVDYEDLLFSFTDSSKSTERYGTEKQRGFCGFWWMSFRIQTTSSTG